MKNLKRIRKARGITQEELAASSNCKQSNISLREKAGVKTLRVAKRYAAVLGCDPLELLG